MFIDVPRRNDLVRRVMFVAAEFYVRHLGLETSNFALTIEIRKPVGPEEGVDGLTYRSGNHIYLFIDSRLSRFWLLVTLAHEMIHVHQIAKGLLNVQELNGELDVRWRGKPVDPNIPYEDRPWEVLAYKRQLPLLDAFTSSVSITLPML